jgi:hypothetical protein
VEPTGPEGVGTRGFGQRAAVGIPFALLLFMMIDKKIFQREAPDE